MKNQNQALVLKLIATRTGLSRVDIARITGLTKMTISNIAAELLEHAIIEEDTKATATTMGGLGRNPISLKISGTSPCILGVSIKRGLYQFVLCDLSGAIVDSKIIQNSEAISADDLLSITLDSIDQLVNAASRPILGIGIACIGPINSQDGHIVNPANFWGIQNVPIVTLVEQHTGLPAFLINDGNAGALAEKTYGAGRDIDSFLYLHIMYGIGGGLILEDKLYNGTYGQSGEIGHSTINFAGPKCNCGNTGCLELYANIDNIRRHIRELALFFPDSSIANHESPTLPEVIDAANTGDALALAALDRFCDYLAHAIANIIVLLDITFVISDYQSTVQGDALEKLLYGKMSSFVHQQQYKTLQIVHSHFNGRAPVYGAVAMVANQVFQGEIAVIPQEKI